MNLSSAVAGSMMTVLRDAIDSGALGGVVTLYNGTRPATGASAAGCTVVAACTLGKPCGTVDGAGVLNLAPGQAGVVQAALAPTWARITTSAGSFVADCNARLTSDPNMGEEIVVDAPSLAPGAYVALFSGAVGLPT